MKYIDEQHDKMMKTGIKNFNFSIVCKTDMELNFDLIRNHVNSHFCNCITFDGNKINYNTLKFFKTSHVQINCCKNSTDIIFALNDAFNQLSELGTYDENELLKDICLNMSNIYDLKIVAVCIADFHFDTVKSFDEIIQILNNNNGSYKIDTGKEQYDSRDEILKLYCKMNDVSFSVNTKGISLLYGKHVDDVLFVCNTLK